MRHASLVGIAILVALVSSCSTTIVRWPNRSRELGSRSVALESRPDVFADYLWTAPNIRCVQIKDRFAFNGHDYSFAVSGDSMSIRAGGSEKTFSVKKSKDRYADISALKRVTVTRQRWVPRTHFESEMVAVMRFRMVPQTTFDSKGHAHTSMRSEPYTDWQMRMVPRTRWEWESYQDSWYDIPETEYFDVTLDNGDHFTVYRSRGDSGVRYLLQNPQYRLVRETENATFGAKDLNMVFVDSQSDGRYFDPEDRVLFNVWNPYDKASQYRTIRNVLDNYWYDVSYISSNYFLSFAPEGDALSIKYGNEEYIGNEMEGSLSIRGLPEKKPLVLINGRRYRFRDDSPKPIQYGKYHMVVRAPGRLDYETSFTVDASSPATSVEVPVTQEAEIVRIENIFAGNYRVIAESGSWKAIRFNSKEIPVPVGKCRVTVSVDGFDLVKDLDVIAGTPVTIDFEGEISRK